MRNSFGIVTDRRVVYFRAKGWFGGGSRQDIPLKHITSVRVDISRSTGAGVVLGLLGWMTLSWGDGVFLGLLLVIAAVLLLWGSPAVVVNTAGTDLSAARGFPWQRGQANAFVDALRQQLFKD